MIKCPPKYPYTSNKSAMYPVAICHLPLSIFSKKVDFFMHFRNDCDAASELQGSDVPGNPPLIPWIERPIGTYCVHGTHDGGVDCSIQTSWSRLEGVPKHGKIHLCSETERRSHHRQPQLNYSNYVPLNRTS